MNLKKEKDNLTVVLNEMGDKFEKEIQELQK
jgi:hypothetical protein